MSTQTPLKEVVFSIWSKNYERQGLNDNFEPLFAQYIGIPDTEENYNDILATLSEKVIANPKKAVLFDGSIPMVANFDLLNSIKQVLCTLDVFHLSSNDIIMFSDPGQNTSFVSALQYVINLAVVKEKFKTEGILNNFICTILLHTFSYVKDMEFESTETCKCIYYGDITKTEIYFLILLSKMGFDVLYLNPLRDNDFSKVDFNNLSSKISYKTICPVESFSSRAGKGKAISMASSITLQLERQIESQLYDGSGMFKPWQYRKGSTKSVFLNGNLIDLEQNFLQPSKVREGFLVKELEVYVPHFFMVINGEDRDISYYKKIFSICKDAPKTKFITDPNFADYIFCSPEQKSEMVFCAKGSEAFDIELVKKLSFYPYKMYDEEPQNFFLNKINETISSSNVFLDPLNSLSEKVDFLGLCLSLPLDFFDLVNNFDFTGDIPKIVIFLEDRKMLSEKSSLILGLFSIIGFDIIIFSPSGMSRIGAKINSNCFSNIMLDNLKTDATINNYLQTRKESFLDKLFSIF